MIKNAFPSSCECSVKGSVKCGQNSVFFTDILAHCFGNNFKQLHDLIKDCILGPNYKLIWEPLTAPSALIPVTFSSLENTISLVFFMSLYIQNLCYHFLLKRCHVIQASNQKGSRTSPLPTCCTVLKTDC